EAEYRALLAKAWDTPQGRPIVAGAAQLEYDRLRLGVAVDRAYELECEIRVQLAKETCLKILPFNFAQLTRIGGVYADAILDKDRVTKILAKKSRDTKSIAELIASIDRNNKNLRDLNVTLRLLNRIIRLDTKCAIDLFVRYKD